MLVIGPAVFDVAAAAKGEPFLQWRPALGARMGVIDLDGGDPRWIDTDACFIFHFANGFERGGEIVIYYVCHEALNLGYGGAKHAPPRLHRLVLDPTAGEATDAALFGSAVEFPRIDDRRVARTNATSTSRP